MEIDLKPFQDKFLFSESRFNALIAGIGSGKTMMMLLKIWKYCEDYPGSLALVIRREYTDLEASTIKDFEKYFNVNLSSKHEFRFANKSIIMFKHGKEITPNVLKNFTLDIVGIEQVEEFASDEEFTFLRDRLRGKAGPYRQIALVGNTNGHNWVWRLWKNNPKEEFELTEATTFDNADNLPKDFIADLKRMEVESPNHYKRFVMNSWEEMDITDILIPYTVIEEALNLNFRVERAKVLYCDVARYGDDETVIGILQKSDGGWKQVFVEGYTGQSLMNTTGRLIDLKRTFKTDFMVIDDLGLGGGVTDRLHELKVERVCAFKSSEQATQPEKFFNRRAECYWKLHDLFYNKQLQLMNNEKQSTQLTSIKYGFKSNGAKYIQSKEDIRKQGVKSPDYADGLMMATWVLDQAEAFNKENPVDTRLYIPRPLMYRPMSYGRKLVNA